MASSMYVFSHDALYLFIKCDFHVFLIRRMVVMKNWAMFGFAIVFVPDTTLHLLNISYYLNPA